MPPSILFLDLLSYPPIPALGVAYLLAPLRRAGFKLTHWAPFYQQASAEMSTNVPTKLIATLQERLVKEPPDIVLLSAYSQDRAVVAAIAALTAEAAIPLLVGGPAFADTSTLAAWLSIEGISAIFAGEADWVIVDLVEQALAKRDLCAWPGVFTRAQIAGVPAPPLSALYQLPLPDFDSFFITPAVGRWLPIQAGRECLSAQPIHYRPRPVQSVLNEIQVQSARYQRCHFVFIDSSLTTHLALWHALIDQLPHLVAGARWAAQVDLQIDSTSLSLNTLLAAKAAGLSQLYCCLPEPPIAKASHMKALQQPLQILNRAQQAGLNVKYRINTTPANFSYH